LRIIVGRLQWNWHIKGAIWTLGFAGNIVCFFEYTEVTLRRKVGSRSRRLRASLLYHGICP
jgi:hypothetical protein